MTMRRILSVTILLMPFMTAFAQKMINLPKTAEDTVRLTVITQRDPDNPVDTALQASSRWYDFTLAGTKGKCIEITVMGSEVIRPFYRCPGGDFRRFDKDECFPQSGRIIKRFDCDTVRICYFIPYSYEYLNERVASWTGSPHVRVRKIAESPLGNDMLLLRITDTSYCDSTKRTVYIHGRTHTSEVPSSWHLDALTQELAFGTSPVADALRKAAVFYIVPFTNPDGVRKGLSRSNASGINLEINWDRPMEATAPEVTALKRTLDSILLERGNIDMFLNMHSQSDPFSTFWLHTAGTTSDRFYENLLRFASLNISGNPYLLKKDMSFSGLAPRYPEGWIWKRCGEDALAMTFETPYSYYSSDPGGQWVTLDNLKFMAHHMLEAISDYFHLSTADSRVVEIPAKRFAKIEIQLPSGKYEVRLLRRMELNGWEKTRDVKARRGKATIRVNGKKFSAMKIKIPQQ